MKAAVCYAFGDPLQIEEVEMDPPQSGEVKVRLAATAICHSDVHAIRGDWDEALPIVVGHEAAGIVEEIGEGVRGLQPGMPVVVSLLRSCGRCFYCVRGLPYHCESAFALQTEAVCATSVESACGLGPARRPLLSIPLSISPRSSRFPRICR